VSKTRLFQCGEWCDAVREFIIGASQRPLVVVVGGVDVVGGDALEDGQDNQWCYPG
jgi:hypothetical protein